MTMMTMLVQVLTVMMVVMQMQILIVLLMPFVMSTMQRLPSVMGIQTIDSMHPINIVISISIVIGVGIGADTDTDHRVANNALNAPRLVEQRPRVRQRSGARRHRVDVLVLARNLAARVVLIPIVVRPADCIGSEHGRAVAAAVVCTAAHVKFADARRVRGQRGDRVASATQPRGNVAG